MSDRDLLVLRFDAPLMSFGGVRVDERGPTDELPGLALLTGLLGNALGCRHGDFDQLARLQERLRYAVRRDKAGREIVDYQTVDLGQDFLASTWTTRDTPGNRGGASGATTHIRLRHYWADALYTVIVALEPADEEPTLDTVAAALETPARPLFLGRKPCLPARPLLAGRLRSRSLREGLAAAPPDPRSDGATQTLWWPDLPDEPPPRSETCDRITITDERDWGNDVHVGRRFIWRETVSAAEGRP